MAVDRVRVKPRPFQHQIGHVSEALLIAVKLRDCFENRTFKNVSLYFFGPNVACFETI